MSKIFIKIKNQKIKVPVHVFRKLNMHYLKHRIFIKMLNYCVNTKIYMVAVSKTRADVDLNYEKTKTKKSHITVSLKQPI